MQEEFKSLHRLESYPYKNMSESGKTIKVRAGNLEFVKVNAKEQDVRDLYHWTLTLTWPQFAGLVFTIYLAINLVFSTLYSLDRGCIAESHSYFEDFFFSVETFATVGYGHMYPQNVYGHLVSTVEIMTGMFGMAVITGLIFIRFSRPVAKLLFSQRLVVSPFDGKPALMLRVANLRHHAMAEAEFRLMLIRREWTKEGEDVARFYPLPLQFDRLITFPVALTLRHIIDEKSPLHGLDKNALEACSARIVASIVCIDTVIPAPVQSEHFYAWNDVHFGKRFVEIYSEMDDHRYTVDYGRLNDIEDAPSSA